MKITVYILSSAASGSDRVLRGGCWDFVPALARVARRGRFAPGYREFDLGFRLILSAEVK